MNDDSLKKIGTGIILGIIITILLLLLGAKILKVNIFGIEFGFSTETPNQLTLAQTEVALQQTQVALKLQMTQLADAQNNNPSFQPAPSQPDSPTAAVTAIPTPDLVLFSDDFESGIKPEWAFTGQGFNPTNGALVMTSGQFESAPIGDNSWTNYSIELKNFRISNGQTGAGYEIIMRQQDRDNYISLACGANRCEWHKMFAGQSTVIAGSQTEMPPIDGSTVRIEVENQTYRFFVNNQRWLYFTDTSFSNGGIQIRASGANILWWLDEFTVRKLQ